MTPTKKMSDRVLTLGTLNFGKRTPPAEAERIVRRALEDGISLFDTANVYNDGESERILGRALAKERDRARIATKVGLGRVAGKSEGLSRPTILAAIDGSLRRLGTDHVDLYYLHAPDHETPIEETLDTVAELLEKKKIRSWGVSNYASWQILEMKALCDARKMAHPSVSQVIYNVLIREIEVEYLPFARRYGVHTTVYNALAGGLLTGRHARGDEVERGSRFDGNKMYLRRYWTDRMFERAGELATIAKDVGMTLVELGYAWLAGRPGVDSVLLGPVTVEQLDTALIACRREVPAEALARIDEGHMAYLGTDTHYVR